MAKRTFQALTIALAVSLVAFAGFAAGAAGQTVAEDSGDSGESGHSLLQRLHSMGARLHQHGGGHGDHAAGGGFEHQLAELVNQLDLSQEQTERLEAVHQTFEFQGDKARGSMAELHDQLVEQFEQGYIQPDAVRPMIEQHLAEIRSMAYSVTDELLALVNSLDAEQREIVLAHIQGAHGGQGGHGRHGHGGH